jgi:site-specific recombinase XerD
MDDHPDSPAAGPASAIRATVDRPLAQPPMRLLPALRDAIRVRHYSLRTEQVYVGWVRRFVHVHGLRHPRELGAPEVEAFLTQLATQRNVSSSTQGQAKSASLFLYKQVLGIELPGLDKVVSAKASHHLPVVLTPREVRQLLAEMSGTTGLVSSLLYVRDPHAAAGL